MAITMVSCGIKTVPSGNLIDGKVGLEHDLSEEDHRVSAHERIHAPLVSSTILGDTVNRIIYSGRWLS